MNANWRAATMDTIFYNDKSPLLQQHCWLKLGEGTLELCFEMGSPPAMIGKRDGNGHYRVVTPGSGGGTLHRFANEEVLEGSWEMNGQDSGGLCLEVPACSKLRWYRSARSPRAGKTLCAPPSN